MPRKRARNTPGSDSSSAGQEIKDVIEAALRQLGNKRSPSAQKKHMQATQIIEEIEASAAKWQFQKATFLCGSLWALLNIKSGRGGSASSNQSSQAISSLAESFELSPETGSWTRDFQADEHEDASSTSRRSAWEHRYGLLKKFKRKFKHVRVPIKENTPNFPGLGKWVNHQRNAFKKGVLSASQVAKLDALGFVWNLHNQQWLDKYDLLLKYQEKNGHMKVPRKENSSAFPGLGLWTSKQRTALRKHVLGDERKKKLEEIGFTW